MLKKSKAMPYTMQLRIKSSTPGIAGSPAPKSPKRNTQANIEMSMTFLMPNLFMKKGMSRMHSVSEACEMDIRALEFLTAKVSASSGLAAKERRKVLAYPFVICSEAPRSIENMKKMANCPSLKRLKALSPNASAREVLPSDLPMGQAGMVKA